MAWNYLQLLIFNSSNLIFDSVITTFYGNSEWAVLETKKELNLIEMKAACKPWIFKNGIKYTDSNE